MGCLKALVMVLWLFAATGCAALQTTSEVIDILYDDPEPVCDPESVGLNWKGEVCLKFSDGSYAWRKLDHAYEKEN